MSTVDKMCLRLLAVCFLPLVFAVPIVLGVSVFGNAFARLGAPPMPVNAPNGLHMINQSLVGATRLSISDGWNQTPKELEEDMHKGGQCGAEYYLALSMKKLAPAASVASSPSQ